MQDVNAPVLSKIQILESTYNLVDLITFPEHAFFMNILLEAWPIGEQMDVETSEI